MAATVPKSFRIPNPFPSTRNPPPSLRHAHKSSQLLLSPHALDGDSKQDQEKTATKEPEPPSAPESDPSFENRLSQVRLKYRSGTGKKAEQRRAKKSPGGGAKKKGGAVMLPPVTLLEPVSSGLPVEVGFSPYSERLNGRLAGLGLAALLLVELGSGKGPLAYHTPPIIFIQLYTIAAAAALFIKYEKERISVWPEKSRSSSSTTVGGE